MLDSDENLTVASQAQADFLIEISVSHLKVFCRADVVSNVNSLKAWHIHV